MPDLPFLLLGVLVRLALLALGLFVACWVVRLAVRHGPLDARRRRVEQEEQLRRRLDAEGPPQGWAHRRRDQAGLAVQLETEAVVTRGATSRPRPPSRRGPRPRWPGTASGESLGASPDAHRPAEPT